MSRLQLAPRLLPALALLLALTACREMLPFSLNGLGNSPAGAPGDSHGWSVAAHALPASDIAQLAASPREMNGEMVVELAAAQAGSATTIYAEVTYDPQLWHPESGSPADAFAAAGSEVHLLASATPGVAQYGQVMAGAQGKPVAVKAGDVLATLRFAPGAQAQPRTASAVIASPTGNGVLRVDRAAGRFTWPLYFPGDYDQNGEVNISDLSALAPRLGAVADLDHDPTTPEHFLNQSIESVVDGDDNGAITIADVTPIGANFGATLDGFNMYSSTDLFHEYPREHDPDAPNVEPAPFSVASLQSLKGNPATSRRYMDVSLPGIQRGVYYWIRTLTSKGLGKASSPAVKGVYLVDEPTQFVPEYYDPGNYAISYDPGSKRISWAWGLRPDGNRDGMVSVSDLTVLGTVLGAQGPFTPGSRQWLADGDMDGVIGIGDIDAIGLNFSEKYDGIRPYYALRDIDVPADPWAGGGQELIGTDPQSQSEPSIGSMQIDLPSGAFVWFRPFLGDELGPTSKVIQIP